MICWNTKQDPLTDLPTSAGWYRCHQGNTCTKKHILKMSHSIDSCHKLREEFIDHLLSNLEARFPPRQCWQAFACLGLQPISLLSSEELKTWGNDKIETLCAVYRAEKVKKCGEIVPPVINKDATRDEWVKVKQCVVDNIYPRHSIAQLWSLIKSYHREDFPNLLKLASICFILPVHTAGCVRAFSRQNFLKTPFMNRLLSEHVNMLMQIAINGPPQK